MSQSSVSCSGGNNGTALATPTGGTAPYQYQWSNGATTAALTNIQAGNYVVLVKDANQCEISGNVTVTTLPSAVISGVITNPTCNGACDGAIVSTISSGAGPFTYQWSNGAVTKDIAGICAGSYVLTVTDVNGCTTARTFVLNQPSPFTINLGPDRTLCTGQQFEADGTINPATTATYLRTSSTGFTASTAKVNLSLPGTYIVKGTLPNGCSATDTIIITRSGYIISAEFLVASQTFKGINTALINISAPAPDSIRWIIPNTPSISIISSTQKKAELRFNDTGSYVIGMQAKTDGCVATITKKVIVIEPQPFDSLVNVRDPLIKEFVVKPTPNNGNFTVQITLSEVSKVRLRLINLLSSVPVSDKVESGQKDYTLLYNVNVVSGIYLLILETPKASSVMKVIIN